MVVSWTIFDGGIGSSRAAASEKTAGALTDARAEAESVLRLDMRTAWLSWEETESRLNAAKSSLLFAEENLRVTSERYGAGLAPHTEVLDAESMRSAAEARVIHAASERVRAWLRIRKLSHSV